ncbi:MULTISPECIES: hypothetical protein [unclassified Breznakia]|uniref:hypothetical protein n=1 Tax=unclassified Breznakia TaxID=2623764 RepID=UPI002473ABD2|nr:MULTISPECIES: hypothetical protein [unclassified Breznakia]MDH6366264.1 hypothetical protein [Breznakia sp. PH1-1]MDH6403357.1 hypothetical protein [Breznakia sp. PF1-11]MDH6411066.1 hypothetical protein [Breznakia sp. PFB1-11]MDH6413430.1 hypothetical protein [Breznakia sp. PFB1-14]MDH6416781.1 hypothetical protein [Breznakia sp. PFB1-4]
MKEKLYLHDNVAIINFDLAYPTSMSELLGSRSLGLFAKKYLKHLEKRDPDLHAWVTNGFTMDQATRALSRVFRQLIVMNPDEIDDYYLTDKAKLLEFVEGLYNYWKSHQRFSYTRQRYTGRNASSFVLSDSNFNSLLRSSYRFLEQKLQGRKSGVYRQLQAGTNSAMSTYRARKLTFPETYKAFADIPMIEAVMLRTPMILTTRSNKRTGMFEETDRNPVEYFTGDKSTWFCYPAKVGDLLVHIYFHRDFTCSGVSLANLFELANPEEAQQKPDAIVQFANQDGKDETKFFYDEENDIYVGSVSYMQQAEYFGYMKKMVLTLHNLVMMRRGWLPIHGAFVNITLYDGKRKGIMLMGDSGAGKSESIEALKALGNDVIKDIEVVFDDMGTIHIEDGVPYGQGTEIGAFIRLDDLDPGTPYRDMDRSIFINPDVLNARVITPAAPYSVIARNHKIDLFCYANNYDTDLGMRQIEDMDEAKPIFVEGKRMAKGTTQEVGLSTTYFANPFGPMQKQEVCDPIIDEVFDTLKANNIYVGEIFTHLGLDRGDRDGINVAAQELLKFIQEG